MALSTLQNYGDFTGAMGAASIDFRSTTAEITLISGISAVKTADKAYWINGELTFTVVVSNEIGNEIYSGGKLVDELDARITLASSADPVQVNGAPVAYTLADGMLTIDNLPDVAPGDSITITFRVIKV